MNYDEQDDGGIEDTVRELFNDKSNVTGLVTTAITAIAFSVIANERTLQAVTATSYFGSATSEGYGFAAAIYGLGALSVALAVPVAFGVGKFGYMLLEKMPAKAKGVLAGAGATFLISLSLLLGAQAYGRNAELEANRTMQQNSGIRALKECGYVIKGRRLVNEELGIKAEIMPMKREAEERSWESWLVHVDGERENYFRTLGNLVSAQCPELSMGNTRGR